ncbi:hypothetical protein SeGA_3364 [Salmonella enterica subsp. enterica serovar Gaminara str. A4-567]|nr:hypothetical protein SeGA_3364 [Salmonella enterica subsp. enterica serovar Gaminara str. A4-567]
MKKLALSLSLVLAFSSATAAFAAIPQKIRIGTETIPQKIRIGRYRSYIRTV